MWPDLNNNFTKPEYTHDMNDISISSVFPMFFPIIGVIKNNRCFPWAPLETTPYTVLITNVKNNL